MLRNMLNMFDYNEWEKSNYSVGNRMKGFMHVIHCL